MASFANIIHNLKASYHANPLAISHFTDNHKK